MRRLVYVPIIHMESDLGDAASALDRESASHYGEERWARHKETVARFWENLAAYFSTIDASNLKIYQDGLVADGPLGKRIVDEAARRASINHQIIADLMARGAEIRKTEDPVLLGEEYRHVVELSRPRPAAERAAAQACYRLRKDELTRSRDRFVAMTINQTLKAGEVGLLFMGSYHDVLPYLAGDIVVEEVKARDKVNAYFNALASAGDEKALEELSAYVITP